MLLTTFKLTLVLSPLLLINAQVGQYSLISECPVMYEVLLL